MRILHKLLKRDVRDTPDCDTVDQPTSDNPDPVIAEAAAEYSEESNFGWHDVQNTDSSIFGLDASTPGVNKPRPLSRTHLDDADQDDGFDPYNTGTFDARRG